ncbi:MAG: radical SAM protein [Candidatus Aenigmatarchaeota archaeon]
MVVWDWTHLCNLKCRHCYINAGKRFDEELSTEEAKKVVDELCEAGVVALSFAGGEPLMRRDFFEVASYAREKGLYVSVATNGTLITRDVAKRLKGCVDYVEISLDGANERTHDSFRGIPGVFNLTIRGIRNSVKAGNYTCIATTITKNNFHEMGEIYELARSLKVKMLVFFNFVPSGRGKENQKLDLSPEEREKMLDFVYSKMNSGPPYVMTTAPQLGRVCVNNGSSIPTHFFHRDIVGKYDELCEFIGGCGAGRLYCSIEPTGDVQPCVFLPIKVGNIRESSIEEIWHNSPVLQKLRDRSSLKGHCGVCENKFVCGGCRARAYAYFGELDAPDIGCINNRIITKSAAKPRKNPIGRIFHLF